MGCSEDYLREGRTRRRKTMLVFTRKTGEKVCIGNDIVVTISAISGGRVRLGFDCPAQVPVHREEVYSRIRGEQSPKVSPQRAQVFAAAIANPWRAVVAAEEPKPKM